jgi:7-cyano-7-deazaguanine synthase in queuosine biosynthesis
MFSGGLDSTYLLKYLLLKTDDEVVVHHISLRTSDNRWEVEDKCAKMVIEYCSRFRPFEYVETIVDNQKLNYKPLDAYAVRMMAVQHAEVGNIDHIILGERNATDPNIDTYIDWDRRHWLWKLDNAFYLMSGKQIEHPINEMTKQEIYDYVGKELADITWSCRNPKNNKRCGQCRACEELTNINYK